MINTQRDLKRISLMIGEDQYDAIGSKGLNLSWLIRDLIDDYLSSKTLNIAVTDETRNLYEKIVSSVGDMDKDFEPFLKEALHNYLKSRIEDMKKLEKTAFKK